MTKLGKVTIFFTMVIALFTVLAFLSPQNSLAADAKTADLTKYNPGPLRCEMLPGQLVEAIIDCIRMPIKAVVLKPAASLTDPEMGILAFVSTYMTKFLILVIILAVVVFGLKVFNSRGSPYTVGLGTLLRIGIAAILVVNFGGLAPRLFEVFDEIANMGNQGGISIWKQIDVFLSDLLGFVNGTPGDINQGIIALLNGSLFAKSLGAMLTIIGAFAIGSLLMFILQAMYLYLISFIGFAFLLAISPIFVLFFIFGYTERFFSKWFELMLATVLTPLLMFAFLGIFLDIPATGGGTPTPGIIRAAVDDVFIALGRGDKFEGKNYIKRCLLPSQPLATSFLLPTDSNMVDKIACPPPLPANCDERNKFNAAIHTWLNPYMFRSINYVPFTVTMIDCGTDDAKIKKDTFYALLVLFLYTAFLNAMLHRIPDIARDLANGVSIDLSHISSPASSIASMIRK